MLGILWESGFHMIRNTSKSNEIYSDIKTCLIPAKFERPAFEGGSFYVPNPSSAHYKWLIYWGMKREQISHVL